MRVRIIWGGLLGVLFVVLILQSLPWVLLCFGIVQFVAQLEFSALAESPGTLRRYGTALIHTAVWLAASLLLVHATANRDQQVLQLAAPTLMLCAFAYAIIAVLLAEQRGFHRARGFYFRPLLFVTLPLAFAAALAAWQTTFPVVLLLLGASWGADTGAIFSGKFAGRSRLSPRLSPKKTVEGVIGGMLAAGFVWLGALLIFPLPSAALSATPIMYRGLAVFFCLGCALSILGVFGDLTFSMFKREEGIKDYGASIPGHGGMLDRFDSMLFVAPALYLIWSIFA